MSPKRITENLTITNPDLIEEWDYASNGSLTPDMIVRTSNDKVWWKCKKGHPSWKASIYSRARPKKPTGCPYCSGSKVAPGINDLASMFPQLLEDWDYDKNVGIDPSYLSAHSSKRVYWKCHYCGHSWDSVVNNRTTGMRGCPNCSMKSTSFGEQALFYYIKKLFPNAVNRHREHGFELDVYIPELNLGIEFDGYYYHNDQASYQREKRKYTQCQKHNIKLIRLYDSRAVFPKDTADKSIGIEGLHERAKLNDIIRLLLKEIDPASNVFTKRNPYQSWSTIDNLVDVDGDYFDILSDKFKRSVSNSFASEHSELLEEWDYEANKNINPYSLTSGCGQYLNWKCKECGYKWQARIPDRIKSKGCPCCSRAILVSGVNDFATLYSEELKEWDYERNTISPTEVLSFETKVAWQCSVCGHQWEAKIHDKVIRNDRTGCPKCSYRIRAKMRHDRAMKNGGLFKTHPEFLEEWDYEKNVGIDPFDIATSTCVEYWWKCHMCGHSWKRSPNARGKSPRCPKCRYKSRQQLSLDIPDDIEQ